MALMVLITMGFPASLSADTQIPRKEAGLQSFPVSSGETIYKGALVCEDADGYLVPAADTAGYKFVGVAYEGSVNAGTDGATNCRVFTQGSHLLTATSITQAMVGKLMYVTDDAAFDDTATNFVCVGRLVQYVSETSGWVDIGQRGIANTDSLRLEITGKGIGDGLDINRIAVINTAASGERTRALQIALTGVAATEMGGGECFRAEITLSTGMSLAAAAGLIGHYGWIEIEDGVAIGNSALITPFRSVIYAHDNDLSAIGGGGESALFYGQTWGIDSGKIDHGVRIVAGGTTSIGDILGAVAGEGAIGSIFDFSGLYDEDESVCLAQWPIRDTTAGGRPVRWWMGRAVTREAVFLEMNHQETVHGYAVHGRGSLYFSVSGEIYMKVAQLDAQGDWEVISHAAADAG